MLLMLLSVAVLMMNRAMAVESVNDKESVLVEVRDDILVRCEECQATGRVQRLTAMPDVLTEWAKELNSSVASVRDEDL